MFILSAILFGCHLVSHILVPQKTGKEVEMKDFPPMLFYIIKVIPGMAAFLCLMHQNISFGDLYLDI